MSSCVVLGFWNVHVVTNLRIYLYESIMAFVMSMVYVIFLGSLLYKSYKKQFMNVRHLFFQTTYSCVL